ncbi:MAG: OmpA family protein [Hyphomicrobium sp.]|nr:OmpA family protein [Hyphomicrobium sp.]
MRCNPWRWLWGLIPLAMLCWITLHLERGPIEADLSSRTAEALEKAGLGWASTELSGRDVVLKGKASGEGEPRKAYDVARRVWGVRVVDAKTDLITTLDPYTWSAQRAASGGITLSGYVPSEQTRRAVVAAAQNAFPGAIIEDRMDLARGAPERDVFLRGVDHSLRKLARLKTGRVDLNGTALTIDGDAPDYPTFKALRNDAGKGLPPGITLADARIRGPVVSPYQWSATLGGNQVVLSGYAPDDKDREAIFSAAKSRFPRYAIVDRMELGGGAPGDFQKLAMTSLEALGGLLQGTAELNGASILLKGKATDMAIATRVEKTFVEGIPKPVAAKAEIAAPKAAAAPAVTIVPEGPTPSGPYVSTAAIEGGKIVLKGVAPSDEARARLVAQFRAAFPDLSIEDAMTVKAGADAVWPACFEAGLKGLGRLARGSLTLTGPVLDLTGETDDDTIAAAVTDGVKAGVPSGCEARVAVTSTGRVQADQKRKAYEDARLAAEADAKRKADEEARQRAAAAEAEARKKAEEDAKVAARLAEAQRCEKTLADAAAQGVINFRRAEAELDAVSGPTLDRLARIVNECPGFAVRIEGHTDSEGIPERNQPLSERRAKAVHDYLVGAGVVSDRLRSIGYGAEKPIADNETPEGRAKNRRIEFKVIVDE